MRTPDQLNRSALRRGKHYLKPPANESKAFKDTWNMLVRAKPREFYGVTDIPVLTAYIKTYLKYSEIMSSIDDEPLVVEHINGVKENPVYGTALKLSNAMVRYAAVLRIRAPKDQRDESPGYEEEEGGPVKGRVIPIAGRKSR